MKSKTDIVEMPNLKFGKRIAAIFNQMLDENLMKT